MARVYKRPDVDNCLKGILDAMTGIFWNDDSQVVSLSAEKVYAKKEPMLEVLVIDWGEK